MASRRRSLEEKNLKILRELAAYPANRQCFDCHQRGPTYINMTIGSFVCTSCSGLLRGLTPPHRVKSITMTVFTPEEIEFLKARGNEYCKYVWLGTYDSRTSTMENEGKDDHRKRDLMTQKYEKKRWYVDPEIAMKKLQQERLQEQSKQPTSTVHSSKQYNAVPEIQPLSQLFGKTPTSLVVESSQASDKWPHPVSSASAPHVATTKAVQSHGAQSFDLLAEFSGDALVSPSSKPVVSGMSSANGNFANFDSAFNSFNSPECRLSSSQSSNNNRKTYTPPTGWTSFDDDLDPLSPTASAASSSTHSVSSAASVVTGVPTCSSVMPRPLSLPTFAPTNPFKTFPVTNPVSNSNQWMAFPVSSGMVIPASASLDSYSAFSLASKKDKPPLPPPSSVVSMTAAESKKSSQDRYAALADLDSSFHQPTAASLPGWGANSAPAVTSTTTAAPPVFSFSSAEASSSNAFATACNPFASPAPVPWSQPAQKPTPSANPFQSMPESGLPFTQSQIRSNFSPLPAVGNSPSEDAIRTQYSVTNSIPFSNFGAENTTSPQNGYSAGQFYVQNGDISSGRNVWGVAPSASMHAMYPTNQAVAAPLIGEKRPTELSDYSAWGQSSANPFMAGGGTLQVSGAPKSSSSNPFL